MRCEWIEKLIFFIKKNLCLLIFIDTFAFSKNK